MQSAWASSFAQQHVLARHSNTLFAICLTREREAKQAVVAAAPATAGDSDLMESALTLTQTSNADATPPSSCVAASAAASSSSAAGRPSSADVVSALNGPVISSLIPARPAAAGRMIVDLTDDAQLAVSQSSACSDVAVPAQSPRMHEADALDGTTAVRSRPFRFGRTVARMVIDAPAASALPISSLPERKQCPVCAQWFTAADLPAHSKLEEQYMVQAMEQDFVPLPQEDLDSFPLSPPTVAAAAMLNAFAGSPRESKTPASTSNLAPDTIASHVTASLVSPFTGSLKPHQPDVRASFASPNTLTSPTATSTLVSTGATARSPSAVAVAAAQGSGVRTPARRLFDSPGSKESDSLSQQGQSPQRVTPSRAAQALAAAQKARSEALRTSAPAAARPAPVSLWARAASMLPHHQTSSVNGDVVDHAQSMDIDSVHASARLDSVAQGSGAASSPVGMAGRFARAASIAAAKQEASSPISSPIRCRQQSLNELLSHPIDWEDFGTPPRVTRSVEDSKSGASPKHDESPSTAADSTLMKMDPRGSLAASLSTSNVSTGPTAPSSASYRSPAEQHAVGGGYWNRARGGLSSYRQQREAEQVKACLVLSG